MATLKINEESLIRYFGFLKKLDTPSKKKLIAQLNDSIKSEKATKKDINLLYGAWEDSRTTEEIIAELNASRTKNPEIIGFE